VIAARIPMRSCVFFLACLGALVACGSNPPPVTTPAPAPGASDAPAPTGATATSGAVDAPPPKPSLESQREPFMHGCLKKVQAPDYCACGFDQFREIFKDADLSQSPPDDDPRLAALRDKTQSNCGSKLPEDVVRDGFLKGCTGGDARKTGYCQCAWPALRKTLSIGDFLGDFSGTRFEEAKRAMVGSCKGKFPTDIAKADFLTGCTKGAASQNPTCECLWKKVRAKFSTEEIVSGIADVKSMPGLDQCKGAH
jgi:hypothetical protein